jgi:hypothetical protein
MLVTQHVASMFLWRFEADCLTWIKQAIYIATKEEEIEDPFFTPNELFLDAVFCSRKA